MAVKMKILLIVLFVQTVCFGQDSLSKAPEILWISSFVNLHIDATIDKSTHFKILENHNPTYDTAGFNVKEFYRLTVGEKYLYIDADSNMIITDSLKAIKTLLYYALFNFEYQDSLQKEYRDFIQTSVAFSNQVPDIWRTNKYNCKWKDYYALIRKQGYVTKTLKKPNKNPCK